MDIVSRLGESTIEKWLFKGKVIVVTGARQVGKTTMLQHIFSKGENILWLNADDSAVRERLSNQNVESLKGIVGNYQIIVIDEIQRLKNAGLLLKLFVDNFKDRQFIATGSSALDISETIFEPLTGRHLLFHLYPFSLTEIYSGKSDFELEQILPFHLVFGSYPDVYNHKRDAEVLLKNLSNQYLYKDVLAWKDIRKPELLDKLLKLLALQICSEVSINELANQLRVKSETIESYISLLEKSFVIYRLRSYSTNERKEVSKMAKIYFWDNGIRNAVIDNYSSIDLRNDVGQLWENFIISERIKVNTWLSPNTKSYFWRNYNQSEVDYVELNQNKLEAFEIKWNSKKSHTVSKAFTNSYPKATTNIITPKSISSFCRM